MGSASRVGIRLLVALAAIAAVDAEGIASKALPMDARTAINLIPAAMLTAIPEGATLKHFTFPVGTNRHAASDAGGLDDESSGKMIEANGWILGEEGDTLHVLTVSTDEGFLDKRLTTITAVSTDKVVAARPGASAMFYDERDDRAAWTGWPMPPSEGWLSIRDLTLAYWSIAREESATAASIINAFLARQKHPELKATIRDTFANEYNHRMVVAFSNRDYPEAARIAEHLTKPGFAGYAEQGRARKLREQLQHRQDDFKTFLQPTPAEWHQLRSSMSRPEQIRFLAEHLRILNCMQDSQPGGVSYESDQFSSAGQRWGDHGDVINPFKELRAMKLVVADLGPLVPFLSDRDYMPTFSFGRDFFEMRTLHQVDWAVADIVDEIAGRNLANVYEMDSMPDAKRTAEMEKISKWVVQASGRTADDLLLETLNTSIGWREFSAAATRLLEGRNLSALPTLIKRFDDFPNDRSLAFMDLGTTHGEIAKMIYQIDSADSAAFARAHLTNADRRARFWSALILLKHGDKEKQEGIAELQKAALDDTNLRLFPAAIGPLLDDGRPAARAAAESVLANKALWAPGSIHQRGILQHLVWAGSDAAFNKILERLNDESDSGSMTSAQRDGGQVMVPILLCDWTMMMLAAWRTDPARIDFDADAVTRAASRVEYVQWFRTFFDSIKSGKKPDAKLQPLSSIEPVVDTVAGDYRVP